MGDGGDRGLHGAGAIAHVEALAAVVVAVRGDQHFGFDLPEAVHGAIDAEIRRAGGPDGAQAGGRQHRYHCLRDVGEPAGHAIARPYAQGGEFGAKRHRCGR